MRPPRLHRQPVPQLVAPGQRGGPAQVPSHAVPRVRQSRTWQATTRAKRRSTARDAHSRAPRQAVRPIHANGAPRPAVRCPRTPPQPTPLTPISMRRSPRSPQAAEGSLTDSPRRTRATARRMSRMRSTSGRASSPSRAWIVERIQPYRRAHPRTLEGHPRCGVRPRFRRARPDDPQAHVTAGR